MTDNDSMGLVTFRDARPDDAAAIARHLIRTKEDSFAGPLEPHDRDFDFCHDRWYR